MKKKEIIKDLIDLYNDNKLSEKDECTIINTLEFLDFDIRFL